MIGDITSVKAGIIIQQVNAQGVMASGVAKAIRAKWPVVFSDYANKVKTDPTTAESSRIMGELIITQVPYFNSEDNLWVASIVGQQHYGQPTSASERYTSYDALDIGFKKLRALNTGEVLHYPLIGAGLGGGSWPVIREIIKHHLFGIEHHLWLQPGVNEPT